jgi:hypothetical protein
LQSFLQFGALQWSKDNAVIPDRCCKIDKDDDDGFSG